MISYAMFYKKKFNFSKIRKKYSPAKCLTPQTFACGQGTKCKNCKF